MIRQTFPTIRASIAMLAGRWSDNSRKMLRDAGTDIFFVPYEYVVRAFLEKRITIDWTDAESHVASQIAWDAFCQLERRDLEEITSDIVRQIEEPLKMHVEGILNDEVKRKIVKVEITIKTNKGETLNNQLSNIEEAQSFLEGLESHPFFQNG